MARAFTAPLWMCDSDGERIAHEIDPAADKMGCEASVH
jgi:hypothetical protein